MDHFAQSNNLTLCFINESEGIVLKSATGVGEWIVYTVLLSFINRLLGEKGGGIPFNRFLKRANRSAVFQC